MNKPKYTMNIVIKNNETGVISKSEIDVKDIDAFEKMFTPEVHTIITDNVIAMDKLCAEIDLCDDSAWDDDEEEWEDEDEEDVSYYKRAPDRFVGTGYDNEGDDELPPGISTY